MDGYISILLIMIAIVDSDSDYEGFRNRCTFECGRHWDPKRGDDLRNWNPPRDSHFINERGSCCEGRAGSGKRPRMDRGNRGWYNDHCFDGKCDMSRFR